MNDAEFKILKVRRVGETIVAVIANARNQSHDYRDQLRDDYELLNERMVNGQIVLDARDTDEHRLVQRKLRFGSKKCQSA